jgi:hypothetical protein
MKVSRQGIMSRRGDIQPWRSVDRDHVKAWRYSTMKVSRQGIMSRHGDIQPWRSVDRGSCQDMEIFNHEGQ